VAVVGARGQLGAALVRELTAAHEVTALGRAELDITDDGAVAVAVDRIRPDAIVNCAAYNDVDGAEDQPVAALNVNQFAVPAPPGVYHCVNARRATWLELAREAARQLGVEPRLVPVRTADVKLRARRPQFCALSNEKLRSVGVNMPAWQEALARHLAKSV